MSFYVSISEEYIKSRINNWYINIWQNKIYGDMKLAGLTDTYFRGGHIVGYADNYVIANIECKLYALVLGNIAEDKITRYPEYKEYLITKVQKPIIIL